VVGPSVGGSAICTRRRRRLGRIAATPDVMTVAGTVAVVEHCWKIDSAPAHARE